MLDTPPQIGFLRMPGDFRFINIEQFAVRTITDALDRQLVVVLHGETRGRFDFLYRHDVEAAASWQVSIRFEQPAPMRAQGAGWLISRKIPKAAPADPLPKLYQFRLSQGKAGTTIVLKA